MTVAPGPGDELTHVMPAARGPRYLYHVTRDTVPPKMGKVERNVVTLCGSTITRGVVVPCTQIIGDRECPDCQRILEAVAEGRMRWPNTEACGAPTTSGPGAGIPSTCSQPRPCPTHGNPALGEVRA